MRLTRVGDDDGYACAVDGFGGGDFETAGAFHDDECDVVFFRYSMVWVMPLGLLVSVLVLDKDETAMSMPA